MKQKNNDRRYMQIAIDEMMESKSEHRTKKDPMVGAVIINHKRIELGRIHRGKLRAGDHAEYALIDKKLRDQDLEGSILYVTLEPCTSRSSSKTPCSERIVAAHIKKVFIGMVDPNPNIEGHGIGYLQKNGVDVKFFDKDFVDKIRKENEDFIKYCEKIHEKSKDYEELFIGPSDKEKEQIKTATIKDFSESVINDYIAIRKKSVKVPSPKLWTFFNQNGFLKKEEKSGKYYPTIAGLLLFGNAPEDFLHCRVKLEAHIGTNISTENIGGPILLIPEKIKDFLDKYMRTYTEIKEFERIKIQEYPWEALREAIVNAIVHRDYGKEGTHIFIKKSHDKIEIRSPGLPLEPITLEKIRSYNAPPYSRNPRIAETFNYMKLMEERGWGLNKMRDILQEYGLPLPEFNFENGYFVVTIYARKREPGIIQITPDLLLELNSRQKDVIKLLSKKGKITSVDYKKKFKISKFTALKDLNKLIELGIITKRGSARSTYYVLFES